MSPLLFGYTKARQTVREFELNDRRLRFPHGIKDRPFRERLGRVLIQWGEQLVPDQPELPARRAA
ncbi:MAG TPA: hypothetical protein VJR05_14620 [Acidimicrobiia bacterium]|nr:hypothetical protein [Acidimicrobiia bacterium]